MSRRGVLESRARGAKRRGAGGRVAPLDPRVRARSSLFLAGVCPLLTKEGESLKAAWLQGFGVVG